MMPRPRLGADQRRALAILKASGRNGATRALLTALGISASTVTSLVNPCSWLTYEKARIGGRVLEVAKVRITAAGRNALAES